MHAAPNIAARERNLRATRAAVFDAAYSVVTVKCQPDMSLVKQDR